MTYTPPADYATLQAQITQGWPEAAWIDAAVSIREASEVELPALQALSAAANLNADQKAWIQQRTDYVKNSLIPHFQNYLVSTLAVYAGSDTNARIEWVNSAAAAIAYPRPTAGETVISQQLQLRADPTSYAATQAIAQQQQAANDANTAQALANLKATGYIDPANKPPAEFQFPLIDITPTQSSSNGTAAGNQPAAPADTGAATVTRTIKDVIPTAAGALLPDVIGNAPASYAAYAALAIAALWIFGGKR